MQKGVISKPNGITLNVLLLPVSLLLVGKLAVAVLISFIPLAPPLMLFLYFFLVIGIFAFCVNRPSIKLTFKKTSYGEIGFWLFFLFCFSSLFYKDVYIPLVEEKIVLILYNILIPVYAIVLINVFSPINSSDLDVILMKVSKVTVLICTCAFIVGAYAYVDGGTRLLINGIDNPIWLARYLSLAIFCILYIDNGYTKPLNLFITMLGIFFMYKTGSRGPLLGLLLALMLSFWKNDRKLFYRMLIIGGIIMAIAIAYLNNRLLNFDLSQDYSSLARLEYFTKLFETKIDPVWGFGLGNFGYALLDLTTRVYPHNIFLEIYFETGILPTFIFLVLLVKGFSRITAGTIYYLFIISFINSNLSGDLPGNAEFFIFLFILLKYGKDGKNFIPKRS